MKIRTRIALAAVTTAALVFAAAPAHATNGAPPSGTIVDVAVAASGGGTPDRNPWDYDILVQAVLAALGKPESLITFVTDRPGHDRRYAIDPTKIHRELGWQPETDFDTGLRRTVEWYLAHRDWWSHILSGEYQNYFQAMYKERLGE